MIVFLFVIFFIISCVGLQQSRKPANDKFLFIFFLLIIILGAGFHTGGADYDTYVNYFESINDGYSIVVEPTFLLISNIVQSLNFDIVLLFLIYATIGVSLKFIAIKQLSSLCFFSLLFYISYYFILHDLIQIRAGIASGFLLLCIKPIYERNLKRFLLFTTLAVTFHFSAICILPLWFLSKKIKSFFLYSSILVGYLIYFSKVNLIVSAIPISAVRIKIEAYQSLKELGVYNEINVFNLVFLAKVIILYFIISKRKILEEKNPYFNILLNVYTLSLFLFPALGIFPVFAFRLYELYGIVEIILFPLLIYLFKPQLLSKVLVIAIAFVFLSINIFYSKLVY